MKFCINKILYAGIAIAVLATTLIIFISDRHTGKIGDTLASVFKKTQVLTPIQYLIAGEEQSPGSFKQLEKDMKTELVQSKA